MPTKSLISTVGLAAAASLAIVGSASQGTLSRVLSLSATGCAGGAALTSAATTRSLRRRYGGIEDVDREIGLRKAQAEVDARNHKEELQRQLRELEATLNRDQKTKARSTEELQKLQNCREELQAKIQNMEAQITAERDRCSKATAELQRLQTALEEEQELRSIGFHPRKYPDLRSAELAAKINRNRAEQKNLGSGLLKTSGTLSNWTVDGSVPKGRAMQKRNMSSYLRGFNGECDAAIGSVRHSNIDTVYKKIAKACEFYEKQAAALHLPGPDDLLKLRLEEADLVHENALAKQLEREEQARIREEMREEARALREMEEAREAAEREEAKYSALLKKARKEAAADMDEAHRLKVAELERMLEEAHTNKERAISRAQMTRSGHVYVISNIGSFGENVFKVGMTRRLDPLDRVRELGDASVPFPFDIHAMIFTDDAPGLENSIHKQIDEFRLNRVNIRREFFTLTIDDLNQAIDRAAQGINVEYRIIWTRYAEAEQYRQSLREYEQRQPVAA